MLRSVVAGIAIFAMAASSAPTSSAQQEQRPRLVVATPLLAAAPEFADEFARGIDDAAAKLGLEIVPVALDFDVTEDDWRNSVEAALAPSTESMLVTTVIDPSAVFGRFVSQRAANGATVVLVGSSAELIAETGATTGVLNQDPVAALDRELDRLGAERVACLGASGNFPICASDVLRDRIAMSGTVFDDLSAAEFEAVSFDTIVVEAPAEPALDLLAQLGRDDVTIVALSDDGAPRPDNVRVLSQQPYMLGFMSVVSAHLHHDVGVVVAPADGVVVDLVFQGEPTAVSPLQPVELPVSVPIELGETIGSCDRNAVISLLDSTALADVDGDGEDDLLAARDDGTLVIKLSDRTIVAPLSGEPILVDADLDRVRELWLGNELYEIDDCGLRPVVGAALSELISGGAGLPPVLGCRGDELVIDAVGTPALLVLRPGELTLEPFDEPVSPCRFGPIFAVG